MAIAMIIAITPAPMESITSDVVARFAGVVTFGDAVGVSFLKEELRLQSLKVCGVSGMVDSWVG
jgi:hypothetical protein